MNEDRRTAILVGILFIIATVAALVSSALTAATTSSDYLTSVAANATSVKLGVLCQLVAAIAVALIPAFLFPVLRRYNEGLALGYQAIRLVEAFVMVMGALSTLLLVTLSERFVGDSAATLPSYQLSGALLQGMSNWMFVLDPVVFGVGALLFYYVLARTRLVPLWLSLWGFVGGLLVFAAGVAGMFGPFPFPLAVPIAVQEMALAAWLILKGFSVMAGSPRARSSGS